MIAFGGSLPVLKIMNASQSSSVIPQKNASLVVIEKIKSLDGMMNAKHYIPPSNVQVTTTMQRRL